MPKLYAAGCQLYGSFGIELIAWFTNKMPNNLVYMFGKLSQAVEVLVTHEGDARNRVWASSKYLFALNPRAFPKSCRNDVEWIQRMLSRYPAKWPYKSDVEATYRRTKNVTASKIAARIFNVYRHMQSEVDD